jgi:sec-independent protein translocase protein TatC
MALVPFPGPQSNALKVRPDDPEPDDFASARMSFLEHLDELRKRIIRACLGVFVGVAVSVFWISDIFHFLLAPAQSVLPEGSYLIMTLPGEGFSTHVTVALIAGTVIAAPWVMFQVWKFIAPGLYTNEKRFAIPFVLFSSLGFIGGAAFNHYVAFPSIMGFFANFHEPMLRYQPTLSLVFGMYIKMLIGLGLVFQLPTIVFFLARMRMITARWMAKQFKYAFMLSVVIAAIITPSSDPGNLALFTAPMIVLYVLSILIAWAVAPKSAAPTS